jgi:hypothetical protein
MVNLRDTKLLYKGVRDLLPDSSLPSYQTTQFNEQMLLGVSSLGKDDPSGLSLV